VTGYRLSSTGPVLKMGRVLLLTTKFIPPLGSLVSYSIASQSYFAGSKASGM
jgi:hypothetical protein